MFPTPAAEIHLLSFVKFVLCNHTCWATYCALYAVCMFNYRSWIFAVICQIILSIDYIHILWDAVCLQESVVGPRFQLAASGFNGSFSPWICHVASCISEDIFVVPLSDWRCHFSLQHRGTKSQGRSRWEPEEFSILHSLDNQTLSSSGTQSKMKNNTWPIVFAGS